jgi:hypothetical protein
MDLRCRFERWAFALLTGASMLAATRCGKDEGAAAPYVQAGAGGAEGGAGSGAGGADAGGAAGATIDFSKHRLYQHLDEHFTTLEECLAAQPPDFFYNCYQEVDFCPDGTAVIILTDVQEAGTYVPGDHYIDASWADALDAPDRIRFDVVSADHLIDDIVGWDWLLAGDASVTYCSTP